jgi:hypothetical protein
MKIIFTCFLLIHFNLFVNQSCESLNLTSQINNNCHNKTDQCEGSIIKNCIQFSYIHINSITEEQIIFVREDESAYFFSIIEFVPELRLRPPIYSLS